jgi:hypothetical protein
MKKVLLSAAAFFALMLISNVSFGQNIEAQAKQAAKDAGCTNGYHGALEATTTNLGTCDCGDGLICPYTEVQVSRKINPHEAPYVRFAPFARVTFCGTEMLTVECLQ